MDFKYNQEQRDRDEDLSGVGRHEAVTGAAAEAVERAERLGALAAERPAITAEGDGEVVPADQIVDMGPIVDMDHVVDVTHVRGVGLPIIDYKQGEPK